MSLSWKEIPDSQDGGSTTIYGGLDILKLFRLLNGRPNVGNVILDSNIQVNFDRFWLRNAANTNSIKVNAGPVTGAFTYTFPTQNQNDTILLANAPQTITGKTINAANNTIIGVGGANASNRKSGRIQAQRNQIGGSASEGMLAGHLDMGTIVADVDPPPYGTFWRYSTGTTSNTNCGIRYTNSWIRRDTNPRIKVKARTSTPSNTRFLFGLSADLDITPSEAEPIDDTESAFLVGWRSSDANITIFRNGGSNAAPSAPTLTNTNQSKAAASEVYSYEVDFRTSDVLVTVKNELTGTTVYTNTFNSNLPSSTVPSGASIYLRPVFQLHNTDSTSHDLLLCYCELEEDV
jgi:hypothetical protein